MVWLVYCQDSPFFYLNHLLLKLAFMEHYNSLQVKWLLSGQGAQDKARSDCRVIAITPVHFLPSVGRPYLRQVGDHLCPFRAQSRNLPKWRNLPKPRNLTIMTKNYYIYILTNKAKTVLYIGVTNNLKRRIYEHRNPEPNSKSFSSRYKTIYLIYYEHFFSIRKAIQREKQLKRWSRIKKEKLIATKNPEWNFLNDTI